MKTCMFLCFHINIKHESTKTCMFPCVPQYIIMLRNGSLLLTHVALFQVSVFFVS